MIHPIIGARTRATIHDPSLPGIHMMLDGKALARAVSNTAGGASWVEAEWVPFYVRYKPGTSCVVAYRRGKDSSPESETADSIVYAKCFTKESYDTAARKARRATADPDSGGPGVLEISDSRILVRGLPNDAEMSGLDVVVRPKKLQRILHEVDPDYPKADWRLSDRRLRCFAVRYKPEKRAVIRVSTKAIQRHSSQRIPVSWFARFYADTRGQKQYDLMRHLSAASHELGTLRTPSVIHYDPNRHMLLLESLPGQPFTPPHSGGLTEGHMAIAGTTLAQFHLLMPAPSGLLLNRSTKDIVDEALAAGRYLRRLHADLAGTLANIETKIERKMFDLPESRISMVHGDFHPGQLLISDGAPPGLLDFDRSYLGDGVADVGNLCAHTILMEEEGRVADGAKLRDSFLQAYTRESKIEIEPSQILFWTAVNLLFLAARPFRNLRPQWVESTGRMLDACLKSLA